MIRATTPYHEFVFTENPTEFTRILITYSQEETIVLEKEKDDLTIIENPEVEGQYIASFRMTQEEANLFEVGAVRVQVRVLMANGDALASAISTMKIEEVLDDEVLIYEAGSTV